MKKLHTILFIAFIGIGLVGISLVSDEFADAGIKRKLHFTQTITSSQNPGLGYEDNQMALILSPNEGTIYDGSVTFTSSEIPQVMVLHEINSSDVKNQPTWTVDGKTIYGISLVNMDQQSGSFEFTGAALALNLPESKEFVTTISIDAWIRGNPATIPMQKSTYEKENPPVYLSRTNVPAVIPMHKGFYQEEPLFYIITDSSDEGFAKSLSDRQQWLVQTAPALDNASDSVIQKLYVFTNGVEGDGIYGFQDEVFTYTPLQEQYSALTSVIKVEWNNSQRESIIESAAGVIAAEKAGRITFNHTGIILNTPQIVWPNGTMTIRDMPEITDEMSFEGGQVTKIDQENMTVTFVAHRNWNHDGKTIYHIITDGIPQGPAQQMGIILSKTSDSLISSSADFYKFKNGVKGSGAFGFQAGITSTAPGDENYTPMWRVYLVEWSDEEIAKILETKSDIDYLDEKDLLTVSIARFANGDHIVNSPIVDPFQ